MRVKLAQAIAKLQQGELVAIPTETVYGLAGDARNDNALRQIYATKQRPADNPLIVHIASADQVADWASEFPPLAQKLAEAFWPGPLTLVLKAKPEVSTIVRAGEPTVALRVPAHPLTLQLLQQSGLSLAAPSANKYTQISPTTPEHVEHGLGEQIAVLDGGACQVGIESTIVSVDGEDWQLLRHGMISAEAIEKIALKPALSLAKKTPKAPGQHLLHYSPQTPTQLFAQRSALIAYANQHANCAALLFGQGEAPNCASISLPDTPSLAAEGLYDAMHRLDAMHARQLLIELPPATPEWAAILDRLARAGYQGA
jgi:L-threonylcarbamoyladenylate synthase